MQWAMGNLWAVSMGRQFFVCPRLGHQTKTHVRLLQKIKILIIKVNKTIQIIKYKWCYWSQYFVYTTTRSGRITANTTNWRAAQYQCVGQAGWNYVCQYSAVYIYNVHSCNVHSCIFIIKVYFPNLDWVGHENFFCKIRWTLKFLSTS
jgi:hypothetical protein